MIEHDKHNMLPFVSNDSTTPFVNPDLHYNPYRWPASYISVLSHRLVCFDKYELDLGESLLFV